MLKVQWTKSNATRHLHGVGRVQTKVVNWDQRTGRGTTVWIAYTEDGFRIGDTFASDKQAMLAVECSLPVGVSGGVYR